MLRSNVTDFRWPAPTLSWKEMTARPSSDVAVATASPADVRSNRVPLGRYRLTTPTYSPVWKVLLKGPKMYGGVPFGGAVFDRSTVTRTVELFPTRRVPVIPRWVST